MKRINLSPPRIILLSYLGLIAAGTLLFKTLPTTKEPAGWVDALFTVTSAVTVTGLTVLDTGKDLTFLGQALVLLLIQIGGLGYMTLTTFFLVTLGRRIGLKERLILSEALNYPGVYGLVRFLRRVILFVFVAEFLGFLLLLLDLSGRYPPKEAAFISLFHSVSAFNNAGFSTFSNSLIDFRGDLFFNLVICTLIVTGGLGFFVINELYLYLKGDINRLSTHTKLVLTATVFFIAGGWLALLLTELFHYGGVWSLSWKERLLSTFFLSVSSRTAGFSTVDLGSLSESTLFLLILLMFAGASPGGTGGGVKTTTLAVMLLSIFSYIRGVSEVVVFKRSIPSHQIHRAMVIITLSFTYISFVNLIIDRVEEKDFLGTVFEVVSAFSTTGLSLGSEEGLSFCAGFSPLGKLLIVLTMVVGRVGILSFAIAMIGREREPRVRHPEARLLL